MARIEELRRIAAIEFADIVKSTSISSFKLRIIIVNQSFVDAYLSQKLPDKFGFHWECMDKAGTFYRYDNFPDRKWQMVETYPYHFHNGSQDAVETSSFPLQPIEGFRAFMEFVKTKLQK